MVSIGRFGIKYDLVHFRGSYLEVDLGGMRATYRILDGMGCDGALRLHLPIEKAPHHYLVDSKTLIFLSEMRNVISGRNKTTRSIADARRTPWEFYEPGINREIAIREMGGVGEFNDFMWSVRQVEGLKHEEGTQEAITELESLMRGRRVGNNSSGNLKNSGSLTGRIAKR